MKHELKISRNGVIIYRGFSIYTGVDSSTKKICYYTYCRLRYYCNNLNDLLNKIDEELFE